MDGLKECPFCGGVATVFYSIYRYEDTLETAQIEYRAHCCDCGARTSDFLDEQNAINAWNKRVDKKRTCRAILTGVLPAASGVSCWECSECGEGFEDVYGSYSFCPQCGAKIIEEGR